uniref:NADH-ubiquinone oxidoreductase chain 3 n=1 Tax=Halicryptus spinulosus TaxID=160677 RepID=F8RJB1_9BILA|nr:NADH dehydrogenase subunit 3 [Halicryptus spinulosus]
MILVCMFLMVSFFVSLVLMVVAFVVGAKEMKSFDKLSPFECGFDPLSSARVPFSLRFFLVAVIFLIFDVEITLILPIPLALGKSSNEMVLFSSLFFMLVLLVGLFHEWFQGALEWAE